MMDEYLSASRFELSKCLVNAGQTGPLQQKIPCFSIKSWTVLDFLGICSYFMDLKGVLDLPSIFYGSDHYI
jgi:hypothetical protein